MAASEGARISAASVRNSEQFGAQAINTCRFVALETLEGGGDVIGGEGAMAAAAAWAACWSGSVAGRTGGGGRGDGGPKKRAAVVEPE